MGILVIGYFLFLLLLVQFVSSSSGSNFPLLDLLFLFCLSFAFSARKVVTPLALSKVSDFKSSKSGKISELTLLSIESISSTLISLCKKSLFCVPKSSSSSKVVLVFTILLEPLVLGIGSSSWTGGVGNLSLQK